MKKILSMILILTMGAALLAGCGGSSQGTGIAGGTATASSVSAADPAAENSAAAEVPEGSYVIYVLDEESGDPIEDAIVQFCSDTECRTGTSDAAGKAVFESAPGDYTAHVLKAPEGYDAGSEEFDLTPEVRSIEIKLKKADDTAADEIATAITVKEPVLPEAPVKIGDVLTFETTDLDGNPVKSEDLFAGHKVTMINIWGTWCTHCIIELPDLEELSHELEEKGCQLVGLCDDALGGDETILAEAKRILEENAVTYTNIVQTEDLQNTLQLSAFPTTYFVDSEGKVLTLPVVGRDIDQYRARIDEALAIVG